VALGIMLSLIPLWLASSYAQTAELIDPGGGVAKRWRVGLAIVSALTFVQITSACARGGRLRHFLWPVGMPFWLVRGLRSGGLYAAARDGFWEFVAVLRLPYYFRLGLIGFLGTLAWIVVPAGLIAASGRYPPLGFLGAMILAFVAPSLPFLQVRYHVKSGVSPLFLPEKTNRHRAKEARERCTDESQVPSIVMTASRRIQLGARRGRSGHRLRGMLMDAR
jgi:hypothetical protein